MREMIIVEENDQIQGTFSGLDVSSDEEFTVPPQSTVGVLVPFKFKTVNSMVQYRIDWRIKSEWAMKGLILTSAEQNDPYTTHLVFYNTKHDRDVVVPEAVAIVEATFNVPVQCKAINKDAANGVVDLNLGAEAKLILD